MSEPELSPRQLWPRSRPISVACLAIGALAILTCGCGSNAEGESVYGSVSYKGQPLPDVAITFFPERGRPQTASLDANGNYSTTLPVGNYKVTVSVGASLPPGWKEGDPLPPPSVRLPAHYTIRARTQLSAEVAEGQSEPINFDLQ